MAFGSDLDTDDYVATIDIEDLTREDLIGIINEMSLKYSDEVDATPQEVIEEAFQIYKDK
jgi:hypothetical protein